MLSRLGALCCFEFCGFWLGSIVLGVFIPLTGYRSRLRRGAGLSDCFVVVGVGIASVLV